MKFLLLTFTVTLLLVTVITTAQTRNYQLTVRYGQKNFPSKLYLHYDNKTDSAIERNGTFRHCKRQRVAGVHETIARTAVGNSAQSQYGPE